MSEAEALRREHFPESATTYAFCHKCGKTYPCLPIRALNEVEALLTETNVRLVLDELASAQGALHATETIIQRVRELPVYGDNPDDPEDPSAYVYERDLLKALGES